MKTLDDAVIELNGVLPTISCAPEEVGYHFYNGHLWYRAERMHPSHIVCETSDFLPRAKELGFVGGYRWGIEYKNTGDEPLINDDVLIEVYSTADKRWNLGPCSLWNFRARTITALKITDQRYKPADTSYLDKPESSTHIAAGSADKGAGWYDYDNQKALRLPPVGEKVEFNYQTEKQWEASFIVAVHHYRKDLILAPFDSSGSLIYANELHRFRPLDHATRKAEAEKKRVVDAAVIDGSTASNEAAQSVRQILERLYDAGYLRMPANKD